MELQKAKREHFIFLLLAAVCALLSLAGCGSTNTVSAPGPGQAPSPSPSQNPILNPTPGTSTPQPHENRPEESPSPSGVNPGSTGSGVGSAPGTESLLDALRERQRDAARSQKYGVIFRSTYARTDSKLNGSSSTVSQGQIQRYSLVAGLDRRITSTMLVGVSLGYLTDSARNASNAGAEDSARTDIGLYGVNLFSAQSRIDWAAAAGRLRVDENAMGWTEGEEFGGSYSAKHAELRVTYTHTVFQGRENGIEIAGTAAYMRTTPESYASVSTRTGQQYIVERDPTKSLEHSLSASWYRSSLLTRDILLTTNLRASAHFQAYDFAQVTRARPASGGSTQEFVSTSPDKNYFSADLGLILQWPDNRRLSASYRQIFGNDLIDQYSWVFEFYLPFRL